MLSQQPMSLRPLHASSISNWRRSRVYMQLTPAFERHLCTSLPSSWFYAAQETICSNHLTSAFWNHFNLAALKRFFFDLSLARNCLCCAAKERVIRWKCRINFATKLLSRQERDRPYMAFYFSIPVSVVFMQRSSIKNAALHCVAYWAVLWTDTSSLELSFAILLSLFIACCPPSMCHAIRF